MFNSTFFLSIFSQKRSRREGLGCWMCPCGSGPLGAGCREGNVTVSRDGTGFSHVFTTSTQLLSAIYSQHLSAILSAIPPTSTYLRSCRLLLWSWKVWRPKKQAKRQVQTKAHGLHGCFSRMNMSKSRDLPPQWMTSPRPRSWARSCSCGKDCGWTVDFEGSGQSIIRVLPMMTLEIGFECNELMLDRTSRNFQDLYSSYLIQRQS